MTDDLYEELFGPPSVAAADLHELRGFCHNRNSLQPTPGSATVRELCRKIDPTWPQRALTNEKVMLPPGSRLRGRGLNVQLAESTMEAMLSVAGGKNAASTKKRSASRLEPLWPAQNSSWGTWVMQALDLSGLACPEIRQWNRSLDLRYVHPTEFMMAVRAGGTPYLDAVGVAMDMPRTLWKFASIILEPSLADLWTMGLNGFQRSWLDMFPRGELALWLRSMICNGQMTSHQLATYMGLSSARSCSEGWM